MPLSLAQPGPWPVEDGRPLPDEVLIRTAAVEPPKFVIGWREWIVLPQFGVKGIKAKVDTGARSSALHTHSYETFRRHDQEWVRFILHPLRRNRKIELECEAPVLEFREVKDSGGHCETRPFIETTAVLGNFRWSIRLSLTNRESMRFRMLLGRAALSGLFLIDARQSYLMGRNPWKQPRREPESSPVSPTSS